MTVYPIAGLVCLEMFGIANDVQDFLNNSMTSWKLELNISGEKLGEDDFRRGTFQGDSLSQLLFALSMVPLTWLFRRAKAGYKWGIVCQNQEPNRFPGVDGAYIQWGHWYVVWNKEVWNTYHIERKSN